MADLRRDGLDVVLALTCLERLGALHAPLRIPRAAISDAQIADDPWPQLRGMRAPGTGLPGVIMLGTMRGSFGKDFCAIYGHRPAVVLELEGARFARVLVTVEDPVATLDALALPLPLTHAAL